MTLLPENVVYESRTQIALKYLKIQKRVIQMKEINKDNNPLVSIIIPSYNHCQYISKAINSVLTQDYKNIELIVIDDGSTDNTGEVLSKLATDERMKIIINTKNQGQSAVINQGLNLSSGKFVCFLPSDDWFLPKKISRQVEKFLQCDKETGVVYGKGARYYPLENEIKLINTPMYRGWVLEHLVNEGNFVYPVTPMFRRECFEFARPDESYKAEGEAIYLKIAIKYKFEYIDELVAIMRDHERNSGKNLDMMLSDNIRYWNEFFSRSDIPLSIKKLKKITLAKLYRTHGLAHSALAIDFNKSRKLLVKSIYLNSRYLIDYKVIGSLLLSILPKIISRNLINLFRQSPT